MKPILSIIHVYYNTPNEITSSIKSLKQALGDIPYEVIIVDNASSKKLPEDSTKLPNLKIINNIKNYGYGKGLNQGAEVSQGKYLLLVNPDVEFTKDSIKSLINKIRSNPKIGVIGPQFVNRNGETLQSISGMPRLPQSMFVFSFFSKIWPKNPFVMKYHNIKLNRKQEHEVDAVGGACILVRKSAFDAVGGFDERFFMYFEEADFCFRIKKMGYKIIYLPKAKVIHFIGKSTQDKEWIEKTFEQSRFKFFKKYHGLIPALLGEFALRFFKPLNILLLTILTLSAFLNFYKLNEQMIFIGDQGWFYLSARDMLLTGNIPLVGITASHAWLHQGPFWTYMIAILLWIFRYNPLSGGYFTAFLGVLTVLLIYKLGKIMFSRRVGLISALLFVTSPSIIINSQMPYHTSPIPLLTLGLIYFAYRWIRGNIYFFPLIFFILALLYNFELATQILWFSIGVIYIFGFIGKKKWTLNTLNKKILSFSTLLFVLPMLPVVIYDVNHKFVQTLKFIVWVPYRVFGQFLNLKSAFLSNGSGESVISILNFLLNNYKNLIFISNYTISLLIMFLSIGYIAYYLFKHREKYDFFSPINTLIIFVAIPLIGIFINMTPSYAYTPLLFPSVIILTSWVFAKIMNERYLLFPTLVLIFLITISNVLFILDTVKSKSAYGLYFSERLNAVKTILKEAKGESYEIKGEGSGSQFESFTMNYEYLAWWLGKPPSKESAKNLFIISENKSGIVVKKEILNK